MTTRAKAYQLPHVTKDRAHERSIVDKALSGLMLVCVFLVLTGLAYVAFTNYGTLSAPEWLGLVVATFVTGVVGHMAVFFSKRP